MTDLKYITLNLYFDTEIDCPSVINAKSKANAVIRELFYITK